MKCKDCKFFELGWCNNIDTIQDPDDNACIGFDYKEEEEEEEDHDYTN